MQLPWRRPGDVVARQRRVRISRVLRQGRKTANNHHSLAVASEETEGAVMKTGMLLSLAAVALASTAALTPLCAADMTFERALNADQEPPNWLLHHKNSQGHRFSQLKHIDTGT